MNEHGFHEIYDFIYTPYWQTPSFIIVSTIVGAFLVGALVIMVRRYIKRRRAFVPPLSPWDWAQTQLDQLADSPPESQQEFKIAYFKLTLMLKSYLQRCYGWPLEDKTDDEFIVFLEEKKFDAQLCAELRELLASVLEIKFADAQTMREKLERDIATAQKVIKETKHLIVTKALADE